MSSQPAIQPSPQPPTARAREARRRRTHYQERIAAGQSVLVQIGAAWTWVLAEARALAKARPRRWRERGTPVDGVLAAARDDLIDLASRLNEEGARR